MRQRQESRRGRIEGRRAPNCMTHGGRRPRSGTRSRTLVGGHEPGPSSFTTLFGLLAVDWREPDGVQAGRRDAQPRAGGHLPGYGVLLRLPVVLRDEDRRGEISPIRRWAEWEREAVIRRGSLPLLIVVELRVAVSLAIKIGGL